MRVILHFGSMDAHQRNNSPDHANSRSSPPSLDGSLSLGLYDGQNGQKKSRDPSQHFSALKLAEPPMLLAAGGVNC